MFDPEVVDAFLEMLFQRSEANIIKWVEPMSFGNPSMDQDHKILISIINQLVQAINRQDYISFDLVVEELTNYTNRHFNREEKYLRRGRFPLIEDHHVEHEKFTQNIVEIRNRFIDSRSNKIQSDLIDLLGNWLQVHILVEDRKYYEYFQENGHPDEGL
jgi:hemerythrin